MMLVVWLFVVLLDVLGRFFGEGSIKRGTCWQKTVAKSRQCVFMSIPSDPQVILFLFI